MADAAIADKRHVAEIVPGKVTLLMSECVMYVMSFFALLAVNKKEVMGYLYWQHVLSARNPCVMNVQRNHVQWRVAISGLVITEEAEKSTTARHTKNSFDQIRWLSQRFFNLRCHQ